MFEFDIGYAYILVVIAIIVIFYLMTREPEFKPPQEPEKISGDFTLQQLKQFDGEKKPQIFLAIKGVIYDVTNSSFYQKDAAYGVFSGHDASINLSKMSHDQNLLNKWGEDYKMNEDQQNILNDWVKRFEQKYRRVGVVKKSND